MHYKDYTLSQGTTDILLLVDIILSLHDGLDPEEVFNEGRTLIRVSSARNFANR
jgi:hypothetical protein